MGSRHGSAVQTTPAAATRLQALPVFNSAEVHSSTLQGSSGACAVTVGGACAEQQLKHAMLSCVVPGCRYEADRRFPQLRRRYSSKFMDHEEIESILHVQVGPQRLLRWAPLGGRAQEGAGS